MGQWEGDFSLNPACKGPPALSSVPQTVNFILLPLKRPYNQAISAKYRCH